jgi:hypothetical protein
MPPPRALDASPRTVPRTVTAWVLVAALASGAWRLAFLTRPLAPDEAGLLLIARQWSAGSSLYGDYFVDRPPGLVAFFWFADALGGETALRLLTALAAVTATLLAARLGTVLTGEGQGGTAAAVATALFLSLPTFGVLDTNAEMLACPAVLAGLVLLAEAWRRGATRPRAALLLAAAAGCAGAVAVGLKQNILDVFVVAVVVAAYLAATGRWRPALFGLAAGAVGALASVGLLVAGASWRGTSPAELWEALYTFRLEAAVVIGEAASEATSQRGLELLGSLLLSGAALLVIGGLWAAGGMRVEAYGGLSLRALLAVLLGYEAIGVALGGSYWLHYQLLLTPGLALAAATIAVAGPRWRMVLRGALGWTAAVAVVGLVVASQRDLAEPVDRAVIDYLDANARPGDTAIIGFGRPNILVETGLTSPYPQLWSLPVRVLDPELRQLTQVLRSPQRPTWVVAKGRSLASWGVDASVANQVLRQHYEVAATVEGATIYRRSGIVAP